MKLKYSIFCSLLLSIFFSLLSTINVNADDSLKITPYNTVKLQSNIKSMRIQERKDLFKKINTECTNMLNSVKNIDDSTLSFEMRSALIRTKSDLEFIINTSKMRDDYLQDAFINSMLNKLSDYNNAVHTYNSTIAILNNVGHSAFIATTKADDSIKSISSKGNAGISSFDKSFAFTKLMINVFFIFIIIMCLIEVFILLFLPQYVSSKIRNLNATSDDKRMLEDKFNKSYRYLKRNPSNIFKIIRLILHVRDCKKYQTCDEGELKVAKKISGLSKDKYRVLNNFLFKTNSHVGTTQIDHVIISLFGIFVLETKNLSDSFVFQNQDGEWIQRKANGKEVNLGNAVKQNNTHIEELKNIICMENLSYTSIIVLANNSYMDINKDIDVEIVPLDNLIETLSKFSKVVLSKESIENVYQKLLTLNITDPILRMEHINSIKRVYDKSTNSSDSLLETYELNSD